MSTRNIVWIASYPKSGNTWLRIFLGNYLSNSNAPMAINRVSQISISDSAATLYRKVAIGPFNSTDPLQVLGLRRTVLEWIASNGADVNLVKTHNVRSSVFGIDLIPADLTRAALYVIRDPRDVAISYARHFGRTLDAAIEAIGRKANTTAGRGDIVKQFLGSWSDHVTGWSRTRSFPVLMLRYEDLKADALASFARALSHIGVASEPERLDRAIRFSSFEELRRQEDAAPFVERSTNTIRFFHTGTAGQWRGAMTPAQSERIIHDHGAVMREYGYLDS